jgi:MFS family permease
MSFFSARYFTGKISEGFVWLFIAKTLNYAAGALLGIFLPIFLYNLFGGDFALVMAWYLIGGLCYVILVAYGAQFLNRFGFRTSLQISAVFGALYYSVFYFVDAVNLFLLIPLSIVMITLWRMTYWLPYHIKFTELTKKKNRGKQISILLVASSILGALAPLCAGVMIERSGFDLVFSIAMFLMLISMIPYFKLKRTHEPYSWSYSQTWRQLFLKKNQAMILPLVADGAENVVGVIVWPIFIFTILEGNYLEVGAISTLIIGATIVIQLLTGSLVDTSAKKSVLRFGSMLYSLGWVIKIFVATAFHIFVAGIYHNIMKIFMRTSFDTLVYEIAADQGHFVDEFSTLREIAIGIGRILMLSLAIILSIHTSIEWTFALAAIASLMFNLLYSKKLRLV